MLSNDQRVHLPSILQLLISGFGLIFFLTSTVGLFIAGIFARFGGGLAGASSLPFFTLGWTSLAVCLLLLPSLVYALLRLFGRDDALPGWKLPNSFRASLIALALWPVLLLIGQAVSTRYAINWIFLPPIQVLVVMIPLWFLVELGRRGLPGGSPQRRWGVLSVGLVITPTLAVIVEIALLIVLFAAWVVWLVQNPQALNEVNRLAQRLALSPQDSETILRILRPYLQRPVVIYALLAILAGVVPLIEELLKPLGVWGVASLRLTPAEGFVAGLISGAAFAMMETSGVLGQQGAGTWAGTVIARSGTGLLHTVTAGLTGWGLALAWSKGAYLRLAGLFLLAFSLHAAWNTLGIFMGVFANFRGPGFSNFSLTLGRINLISPYALGVLAVTMLLILIGTNRSLKKVESREQ